MENRGTQRRPRVVLVPFPFQGHLNPMLQLGTVLQSKGFSITVVHTQYNSPNPSNHPDFTFLPIADGLTDGDVSGDRIALTLTLNTNCEAELKECLARMIIDKEGMHDQVVCVIYDTIMHAAEAAASHLKLPSIVLRTTCAAFMAALTALPALHAAGYVPVLEDSMLQEPVPQFHPLRFKDLPHYKFENLEFVLQLTEFACNVRTSSAIIWNSPDFLEHPALAELQKQHKIPFFSIGPLFKIASASSSTSLLEEDSDCIAWLDKQASSSVLYVSLGSLASVEEKELAEMAWGLANSGQPFLWVIRPGSVRGSQWIELLPEGFKEEIGERGYIVKWAPQKKVLAHGAVGGFWSHCGWNSTLESISEGVPMICAQCLGDQTVNSRYISEVWMVGLKLENEVVERGEVERLIRRLMADREGEEMRQRATDLKEKVELCINKGGSSYNSLNDLTEYILSL